MSHQSSELVTINSHGTLHEGTTHYYCENSLQIWRKFFGNRSQSSWNFRSQNAPNESKVRRLIKKFEETGSIMETKSPLRHRTGRSLAYIAVVSESVADNPGTSIRHRSQQLDIQRSTLQWILTKDLHLHAYKIQLAQELKPTDHLQRRNFVNWVLENQEVDDNFSHKIIFSDEAHFQLNGYVNKQNCRIWGTENPRVINEKPLHPQMATVWWCSGFS